MWLCAARDPYSATGMCRSEGRIAAAAAATAAARDTCCLLALAASPGFPHASAADLLPHACTDLRCRAHWLSCRHVGEELLWEGLVPIPAVREFTYRLAVVSEEAEVVKWASERHTVVLPEGLEDGAIGVFLGAGWAGVSGAMMIAVHRGCCRSRSLHAARHACNGSTAFPSPSPTPHCPPPTHTTVCS